MGTSTMHKIFSAVVLALGIFGSSMALEAAPQTSDMPSFWCSFTEPFITVYSARNGLRYDDNDANVGMAGNPAFKMSGAAFVLSGQLKDGKTFTVNITKGEGSDGMSEYDYPFVGVLAGSAAVTGGCVKLPDGTELRQVVGVAENDKLNLRSKPNAEAKIVGRVHPKGFVWLKPTSAKSKWSRVSAIAHPGSEQGAVTAVEGWVNVRFLAVPGAK
jgi:uncharacterized membrane protein